MRDALCLDSKGEFTFYIKRPAVTQGTNVVAAIPYDPEKEYASYKTLQPYLKMPKVRLLNHREDPRLVIEGIDGVPVGGLIETETERAVKASEAFWDDTLKMWKQTVLPADELQYSRQMRQEKSKSLDKLMENDFVEAHLDLPVIVNEVEYPPLRQTIASAKQALNEVESTMVIKHGDEQVDNILATRDGDYRAIDPAWRGVVGYGPPSFPINLFIGTNYNFYYHWQEEHSVGDKVNINLGLQPRSSVACEAFQPLYKRLLDELATISPSNQFKENLFENFLRVAAGIVRRDSMDISELFTRPYAYLALANQVYYGNLIK